MCGSFSKKAKWWKTIRFASSAQLNSKSTHPFTARAGVAEKATPDCA